MAMPDDTPGEASASAPASSDAVIAALQAEIVQLRAENAALLGRLADLERRLGLKSSNSAKPPSSDGLRGSAVCVNRLARRPVARTAIRLRTFAPDRNPDTIIDHFFAGVHGVRAQH